MGVQTTGKGTLVKKQNNKPYLNIKIKPNLTKQKT
jgi:hypothetical protein